MLATKEVSLCGGYDKKKSQNIGFWTIQGLMEKLQVHKERDNDIQEHVSAQALFSKHHSKERQNGFGYTQASRGHGQVKRR
jgi:hypothetical protein